MTCSPMPSDWKVYLLPFVFAPLALVLAWLLSPVPGLFLPLAALATGWLGGAGPGLVTAVLIALGLNFFLLPPWDGWNSNGQDLAISGAVFLESALIGMSVGRWCGQRNEQTRLSASYRTLTGQMLDMAWAVDPQGRFCYDIRGWHDRTGQSFEEARSGWQLRFEPDCRALVSRPEELVRQAAHDGPSEFKIQMRDGSWRVFRLVMIPVRDRRSNTLEWLCGAIDVNDARSAEQEAHAYRHRLQAMIDGTTDLVWAKDLEGRYILVNRAICELYGTNRDNLLGQEDYAFWNQDIAEDLRANDREAIALGHTIAREEGGWHNGARRSWWSVKFPLRDEHGEIVAVCGFAREITQQRLIEEQLKQARDEAETANRIKDEFLANLSHELRTPLQAILGWAQLLQRTRRDDHDLHEALRVIVRSSEAQAQMIEDVLDVSRITSGRLRLETQPLDPASVVEAAVKSVRPTAEAKGISLEVRAQRDAGQVLGDPTRLQQVVWNLLTNAIKFTPTGGHVTATIGRVANDIEITISDTGHGIPEDFLPFMFERFRQAGRAGSRGVSGLGLGLALVRHLTEMHGGTVSAESGGEGLGSTFRVRLPVRMNEPTSTGSHTRLPGDLLRQMLEEAPPLMARRVLVVEDEPDARELLTRVLRGCGAEVDAYDSAEKALTALESNHYDCLVSDIALPGRDGYSLISEIRATESIRELRTMPALAMTAFARPEDERKALDSGFQRWLRKPVDPLRIASVLVDLLEEPAAS
jgi:PAS domain S-box-containing protein